MQKKLVIFDCDGVLVDSEIIAHQVLAEMVQQQGCPLTIEESIREFTGVNKQRSQEIFYKKYNIEVSDDFWEKGQSRILDAFEQDLIALNQPTLSELTQKNVSICVASSSQRQRVLKALTVTNQLVYFNNQAIFTSQQVTKGKPAPDLFLFAAAEMGFLPEDCIVIEDSPAGIEAALAAHMTVVGFVGGAHTQFSWYQKRIENYSIPIIYHSDDLLEHLFSLGVYK